MTQLPDGKYLSFLIESYQSLITNQLIGDFSESLTYDWVLSNQHLISPLIRYDYLQERFVWFSGGLDIDPTEYTELLDAGEAVGIDRTFTEATALFMQHTLKAFKQSHPDKHDDIKHLEMNFQQYIQSFSTVWGYVTDNLNFIITHLDRTCLSSREKQSLTDLNKDDFFMCSKKISQIYNLGNA